MPSSRLKKLSFVGVDRSKGIAQDFNRRYGVESLCRGFPKRVQLLVEGKGKKLRT